MDNALLSALGTAANALDNALDAARALPGYDAPRDIHDAADARFARIVALREQLEVVHDDIMAELAADEKRDRAERGYY